MKKIYVFLSLAALLTATAPILNAWAAGWTPPGQIGVNEVKPPTKPPSFNPNSTSQPDVSGVYPAPPWNYTRNAFWICSGTGKNKVCGCYKFSAPPPTALDKVDDKDCDKSVLPQPPKPKVPPEDGPVDLF
jgi:hypothetical protein